MNKKRVEIIKCPHCGYEYTDDDIEKSNNDLWSICPNEEMAEEICPDCGELFFVRGSYSPEYETFKTEDELD